MFYNKITVLQINIKFIMFTNIMVGPILQHQATVISIGTTT